MLTSLVCLSVVALCGAVAASGPPPAGPACTDCPNVVLLLTDDQDLVLGGFVAENMRHTFKRIKGGGADFTQWRIHTPICAPSRSELQTGRYYHNIRSTEYTPSPAVSSGAVAQVNVSDEVYTHQFAHILRQQAGSVNSLYAKCMNGDCGKRTSATSATGYRDLHTDADIFSYDRWFEHAGFVNGDFFDTEASGCSWPWDDTSKECHTPTSPGGIWKGRGDGYDTSTAGNMTVDWIKKIGGKGRPFFVYYAPHAPHSPATPAPWYESGTYCDNVTSPRTPDYNYSGFPRTSWSKLPPSGEPPFGDEPVWWWNSTEFHELISSAPWITDKVAEGIDELAQKRCKTLLSVDDSYNGILDAIESVGELDNTYVIVTSDHGYNLGQHMIPSNKFLLYEHSLKIPFVVSGPGIPKGTVIDFQGTNVDVAPTILEMMGIEPPEWMDGRSVLPLLVTDPDAPGVPGSVKRSLQRNSKPPTRTDQFFTYYSQGDWIVGGTPLDDWSNTYIGLRHSSSERGTWKFGIYDPYGKQTGFTKPYMFELFDLDKDPWELKNVYNATLRSNPELIAYLNKTAYNYYNCVGAKCPQ